MKRTGIGIEFWLQFVTVIVSSVVGFRDFLKAAALPFHIAQPSKNVCKDGIAARRGNAGQIPLLYRDSLYAHEALVSYEDFMAVKVMMQRDMRCSPDQDEAHLFSGFLFCGDCQQPMIRKTVPSKTKKYIYYVCSTNKHSRTCSPHSIAAKEVEEKVFRAIHDQIELVINLEHALAMIERLPSQSSKAFNYEAQIAKIEEEIERYAGVFFRVSRARNRTRRCAGAFVRDNGTLCFWLYP